MPVRNRKQNIDYERTKRRYDGTGRSAGEVLAAADDAARSVGAEESAAPTGKYGKLLSEEGGVRKLTGMYRNWFLDYASYVILERAVPHVQDGLKPVQRRILHAMKAVDDGRYNKVANIVGSTMLITRMEMPQSRMRWCSWDRRTCWWIVRETGEIS